MLVYNSLVEIVVVVVYIRVVLEVVSSHLVASTLRVILAILHHIRVEVIHNLEVANILDKEAANHKVVGMQVIAVIMVGLGLSVKVKLMKMLIHL
jgi:hypothetical protein